MNRDDIILLRRYGMLDAHEEDSMFAIPHYSDYRTTAPVHQVSEDDSDERCEYVPSFHTPHRRESGQHNASAKDRRRASASKPGARADYTPSATTARDHHAAQEGHEVLQLRLEMQQMKTQLQSLQRETARNTQAVTTSTVRSTQRVQALESAMQSMCAEGDLHKVYSEIAVLHQQLSAERQATIVADLAAKHEQDVTFYNLYRQIHHYIGVSDPQILMDIKQQIGLKLKDLQQTLGPM